MKKVLALLLVVAMVCGAFIPAFAATDAELAAEAQLQELGILNDDRADDSLTRAEMVVLLSRMLGEEAAAKDFPVAPSFADATGHWAANYIAWAESMAYVNGIEEPEGSGTFVFEPDSVVTLQQYQAVLLRALGYEVAYADVPAKALELGLVVTAADPTNLKRGETSILTVAALETEMADGSQTLAAKLGMVADLAIVSAEQTDKDEFTVTFNQAVTEGTFSVLRGKVNTSVEEVTFDGAAATVTMQREIRKDFDYKITFGTLEATVAGQESEVSAIEFPYDYANLESYAAATHAVVYYEVKDQFGNDVTDESSVQGNLNFYSIGTPDRSVKGQITIMNTGSTWLLGMPIVVNAVYNDTKGNVVTATKTFEIAGPIKLSELVLGDVQNIGDKDDQQILKDKTSAAGVSTDAQKKDYFWAIPVTALNQYGDAVPKTYFTALSNVVSESGVDTLWYADKDGNVYLKLDKFASPSDSVDETVNTTAFVTVVDTNSGLNATTTFDIPKAGISDLKVMGPVDEVIGNEKAEFEFEAYDAYGNAITEYDTIIKDDVKVNGTSVLEGSYTQGQWSFVEEVLTGNALLKYYANSNTSSYASPQYATFTINNKVSQVSFSVAKDRQTEAIMGFDADDADELVYVIGTYGSTEYTFDKADFVFVDQYGKEKTNSITDGMTLEFQKDGETATTASVVLAGINPLTTAESVKYTARIRNADGDMVDEFEFDVKYVAQEDVDSVKVTEIGTLYVVPQATSAASTETAIYDKKVKLTAEVDGDTAVMPTEGLNLTVTALGGNVKVNDTIYVYAWDPTGDAGELDNDKTYTRTVLTAYDFDGKPVTEAQEVTIDSTEPKAESVVVKLDEDLENAELEGNVLAIAKANLAATVNLLTVDNDSFFFELENQYGVHDAADASYVYLTVDKYATGAHGTYSVTTAGVLTATSPQSGDEFSITVVTDSGLTNTLKVEVK
ncbi:hypothetical protein SANA_31190 [Gottschalkiaceae bacterium SANA]|nr:hypothetical protein SANA_31190 [Gottschalkiaceae bacterium SANA]